MIASDAFVLVQVVCLIRREWWRSHCPR